MQEQNALIGVAIAGYFPDISLSAVFQWTGNQPAPFSVANVVWSLGAAGTQVLFEGGLRGAQVDAARAVWQSVFNYRQTVSPRQQVAITSPSACSSSSLFFRQP
jgi:outer membrane protein TolC